MSDANTVEGQPDRPVENGERNIALPISWADIARWIAEQASEEKS